MDFMDSWAPDLERRAWGPTNKQSTCPCKVGKKAGSEVPRWIFYGFHRFSRILIDLYGFHGFLGPGLETRAWVPTNKQSTCPCKVRKTADLRSQGRFSMDFIDFT